MKRLALFDFDGTITYKDTFLEFMKFYRGPAQFWLGMLRISPWLVALKLKLVPNHKVKERAIRHFFAGETLEQFNAQAKAFCRQRMPALIKHDALAKIKEHQQAGDRVVIVSASAENWILPWAEQYGLEVLATRLCTENGRIVGTLEGKNCHGEEKCVRVRSHINISEYAHIYAYGDTSGDREMLGMAHEPHYRVFRG